MKCKTVLMDSDAIRRSLRRIAHEISERNNGLAEVALLGIYSRGATLADFLKNQLEQNEEVKVPLGYLDITLFRDDRPQNPDYQDRSVIPFDVQGKTIVLVDDVLFTGRTIRAAIEAIFERGRPSQIQVAVLVDRGHRELPIRADYVGKNIPTSQKEEVVVNLQRDDGISRVALYE